MSEKSLGEQTYEQFADRYAANVSTKAHNAYLVQPAVISLLPVLDGLRVLDAGCGSGHYAEYFLNAGAAVVAIDVTPQFVEIASRHLGNRATVIHHDLSEPLAFAKDDTFDLVFSNLVLDHIAEWEPIFSEFHRVLRPHGTLVISFPHPFTDWQNAQSGRVQMKGEPNYFELQACEYTSSGFSEPKPVFKSYRRPLEMMINPLCSAGFTLETLVEPRPNQQFQESRPDIFERESHNPTFMCIRAKK